MKTKENIFLLLLALFIVTGCAKHAPFGPDPMRIEFTKHNLYPEGMAYESTNKCFIVSSAAEGTVGFVTMDGKYSPVTHDPNLTSTTGIKVDAANGRLYVCNVDNGVGAYSLRDGSQIYFKDLSGLANGDPLFMNDEMIAPNGDLYATSSAAPIIFKITPNGEASIFFRDDSFVTGPEDFGFNGIQYDSRGFLLVAHTALNQIIKIPVNNPTGYSVVQLDTPLSMPDGLLLSKNGMQLVVVSGDRILSFISDNAWKSGKVSTNYFVGTAYPTSLTSDGKRVYTIYSPLDKLLSGEDQDVFTIQEIQLKKPDIF